MPSSQPDNETPDERVPDSRLSDWKNAISRAMRGDFGPPGESLRSDILDELADHLSESMKREERAGRSEAEAKERVLNRFGSPSQIAARLWFDGMKGSIMFQRWMMGVSAAALLLAFVAVGIAFWMVQENNQTLVTAVEKLEERIIASVSSKEMVDVHIKCVDDMEGEPAEGVSLILSNDVGNTKQAVQIKTNASGVATFNSVRPGKYYTLDVSPNDLWISRGPLFVPFQQAREIIIQCPLRPYQVTFLKPRPNMKIAGSDKAAIVKMVRHCVIEGRRFESPKPLEFVAFANGDGLIEVVDGTLVADIKFRLKIYKAMQYITTIRFVERKGGWSPGQPVNSVNDQTFGDTVVTESYFPGEIAVNDLDITFPKDWWPSEESKAPKHESSKADTD